MGSPKIEAPPAPPPTPELEDTLEQERRRQERLRKRAALGRASVMLSGARGAAGRPTLGVPALLGGAPAGAS